MRGFGAAPQLGLSGSRAAQRLSHSAKGVTASCIWTPTTTWNSVWDRDGRGILTLKCVIVSIKDGPGLCFSFSFLYFSFVVNVMSAAYRLLMSVWSYASASQINYFRRPKRRLIWFSSVFLPVICVCFLIHFRPHTNSS